MGHTYAIADLHGRYDLLCAAYDKISAHAGGSGKIVHLGDYVDRGPQSRQIIEHLMDSATVPAGMSRICLKGNHEDMMANCIRGKWPLSNWLINGGGSTLISYGQQAGDDANPKVVPQSHLKWIDSRPLWHDDGLRLFVHAGVDPTVKLEEQTEETLLWKLYPDRFAGGFDEKHVVHGHHQFEDGPKLFSGRTDLDTFAWYTGRIVVGVFDDAIAGGPVELIEVVGRPASPRTPIEVDA